MKLLRFGRAAKPKVTEPRTNTRRGVVLLDDTDLSRYQNNYQLYDTGQSTGQRIVLLDAPQPTTSNTPVRPTWLRSQSSKRDAFANSGPVILGGSGGRFHDTPIIAEDHSSHDTDIIHSVTKLSVSSVDALPVSHGAIRAGGPVDLFSSKYFGLLLNWIVIGFLSGGTQALVAPLLSHYFHMSKFQSNAVTTLLNFAWCFNFALALLTDSCPINRMRRKPYITIGWAAYAVIMLVTVCMPSGGPVPPNVRVDDDAAMATQGLHYVIPLIIASFARLLATVACEGMMVELAHREGEFVRGRTQCIVVIFRFIGEFLGTIFLALGANSAEYGGTFGASLPIQAFFGVFGFVATLGIVFTSYLLVEEPRSKSSQPIKSQLRHIWDIAQQRPTWKLMAFGFVCKCATTYDMADADDVYAKWLHARPLDLNLSTATQLFGSGFAAFLIYKLWINTNWRVLAVGSMALGVVIALPIELLTYYDIARMLMLYITKDQLVAICDAVLWLIHQLVIIEIAEPGYEATTYGMISTVYNLASPFMAFVMNAAPLALDSATQNLSSDTPDVRMFVTMEQVVKVSVRIALIVAVTPLLPRHKRDVSQAKTDGARSAATSLVVYAVFVALFVAAMAANLLTLFKSTACLTIAGGSGCT